MKPEDKAAWLQACNEFYANSGGKDLGEFMFKAGIAHRENMFMAKIPSEDLLFNIAQRVMPAVEKAMAHRDAQPAVAQEPVLLDGATKHQAKAWLQVCELLNEVSPNWQQKGKRGVDAALQAIRELKASAVAVDEQLLHAARRAVLALAFASDYLKSDTLHDDYLALSNAIAAAEAAKGGV